MNADRAGAPPAVRAEDILVAYRGRTVVDVPAIELVSGGTYALLGASGAGKSTLLRVLGLLERPDRGRVLFDGSPAGSGDLASRRRISAVFQKPYLLRGTVADNVAYGLWVRGVKASEKRERVASALVRVGLAGWQDRSALTLSGGEGQRVALARALVLEPAFLLLDEPLSYMDPLLKRSLSREFAEILAGERVTTLYVTHDQDEAAVVADRIGVMREGSIIAEGDADTVLGLPADEWLAAFVGMEPSLRGRVISSGDGLSGVDCGGSVIYSTVELPVGTDVFVAVR
ncbi:MAG TPA: ABC transporter ATP-binding protein, partial [Coriobacteriia bacterium]